MSSSNSSSSNNNNETVLLAAVEGGGTSFRVVVFRSKRDSNDNDDNKFDIIAQQQVDSSHDNPQQTLRDCVDFFTQHKPRHGGYHALGIATFGPVGVNPHQEDTYGTILATSPKAAWRGVDFLTPLRRACQGDEQEALPVLVETDVNAPALAEYLSHRRRRRRQQKSSRNTSGDISSVAYITVGTGVGVGLVVNGQTVHGRMHPEGGHVPVQPLKGDSFQGYSWGRSCPFQGKHTVEGLASSVALTERWLEQHPNHKNVKMSSSDRSILATLDDSDEIFDHAVNSLANLCVTLLLTLSMEKIVLGGGLMNRASLLPKIRARTVELLNGYLPLPSDLTPWITTSEFGADAGLHGAMVLAQHAYQQSVIATTTDDEKELQKKEQTQKQQAFQVGLSHGIIVGSIVTAALFQWMAGWKRKP